MNQSPKVERFLSELAHLCRMHGLSISHGDGHGAFGVELYDKFYEQWLLDADDNTGVDENEA